MSNNLFKVSAWLALSLSINLHCTNDTGKKSFQTGNEGHGTSDSVYLISKMRNNGRLAFYNPSQVSTQQSPHPIRTKGSGVDSIITFYVDSAATIYDDHYSVPYLVYSGERLTVSQDDTDFVYMEFPDDSIRNNELQFFGYLIHSGGAIWQMVPHQQRIGDKQLTTFFRDQDFGNSISRLNKSYQKNLKIFNTYRTGHKISDKFTQYATSYLLYDYYGKLFRLIRIQQDRADPKVVDSIVHSIQKAISADSATETPVFNSVCWQYDDYVTRKITNPDEKFEALYNLISNTYTLKEKNYLLTILLLNNMGKDLGNYKIYYSKFINEPENPYKSLVKDNYAIYSSDYKDHHDKDSTFLFSGDNTRHLWADLLDQYHDQVILVDFWASYCQPCREEMPHTFRLLKKYKDKGLVGLFVSIDLLKTNWIEAVNDLHLNGQKNYILPHFNKTPLNEYYKIKTIPRYLLIGRGGKMISDNAPPPDNPALEKLIAKVLKGE